MSALRPRELLAGRRLLITGASGFLGKVWLAHLLEELPETELVLLLRPARGRGSLQERAEARLRELLETSPAFRGVHERLGAAELARRVRARVRAVAGDVGAPELGAELGGPLDLIVHLAGLTDLDPPLDQALAVNVDGALAALELARRAGAQLVHVSTAYVAGRRRGLVPEAVLAGAPDAPAGASFDAARERRELGALLEATRREADDPRVRGELHTRAEAARRRLGLTPGELPRLLAREREAWVEARAAGEARARAKAWGWPNLYTETKALAEVLLARAREGVPLTVVRPTIVEAALRDPFPGWKEGLHTSAPLTYALTHGPLRALPAREDLVLDVVPVDAVARGLTLACAAALDDPPATPRVLHLGSSARNPFPVRRVIELTALEHRRATAETRGPFRAGELLRLDAAASSEALYRAQVPLARRLLRGGERLLARAAERLGDGTLGERLREGARQARAAARGFEAVEEAVERFRPFVLEHDQVFQGDAVEALSARLDLRADAAFRWDVGELRWERYWPEVHLPGLRRWVYPRIEGKRVPEEPRRPLPSELPQEQDQAQDQVLPRSG
ncbi:MAG: SDR family oxidoreductase [Planctomycetota bacterium]